MLYPASPRPSPTLNREADLRAQGYQFIAGVDEAGRGPLAGPVTAGAVIVPPGFTSPHLHLLNDSKLLDEPTRVTLYAELTHQAGVMWGVGSAEAEEIDRINIRQAAWQAMQRAVADLSARFRAPDFVLVDGTPFGAGPWPYEAIVKGDSKSLSIAAASVIAKETRDRLMRALDAEYPGYGLAQHKGYPTPQHLKALQERGACALHRRSFGPVRAVIEDTPRTSD